jgi:hypothetical protein
VQNDNKPPEYAQPDRLFGASAIAAYLYGDASKAKKVYNLHRRVREPYRFPIYRLAGELVAKRSEIEAWFEEQRRRADNDNPNAKGAAA